MPGRVNRAESAVTIGAVVYDDFGAQPSAAKWVSRAGISGSGGASGGDCGAGMRRGGPGANAALAMGGLESCVPASHASHFACQGMSTT